MSRVQQLLDTVGRQSEQVQVEWQAVEAELGTALPADFKEFCEAFGRGEFNGFLYVYTSKGGTHLEVLDNLRKLRRALESWPDAESVYEPYRIFEPGQGGLLRWGGAAAEGYAYYWLVTEEAPENWPIVARTDDTEEWHQYEMSVSEFVYRMITDTEFKPFSCASYSPVPHYESYSDAEPGSLE
ncbi:SMI1/KNR4 family protein [Streptomyces sp. NPDC006314]|uniref:SMI1/KNR4 family protein n=1 Tax=Streptomyces sp. NPDC006314 TaxID=3154475 RepID=UPI0033B99785